MGAPLLGQPETAMTLDEAIRQVPQLGDDQTIFARRPWAPGSDCILIPTSGANQHSGRDRGYDYFLEVSVIQELFESKYVQSLPHAERLAGVIHYAENDAWPA